MYIAAACHSFVQSRRSTLLLCRVGVTTFDYECATYHVHWMAQSYSTYQDRNTTKRRGVAPTPDETLKGLRGSLPF